MSSSSTRPVLSLRDRLCHATNHSRRPLAVSFPGAATLPRGTVKEE